MSTRYPKSSSSAAPTAGVSLSRRMAAVSRWREQYNPLPGLTLLRARGLFESYCRGTMAELQWTYGHPVLGIEASDPELFALLERCMGPLLEMDWQIDIVGQDKRGFDRVLAEEQQAALREDYERVDNLYEAIEHLAMARFRGFSLCERHHDSAGEVSHLEIIDQWNVARCGLRGSWRWNPEARSVAGDALPEENTLRPETLLVRETRRHVNRIALTKFIRMNLSQKDWDAFIEIYGVPGGVIIGPPNIPDGKAEEYQDAAEEVAKGGSGYLPNGSAYSANDGPRGVNPFRDHLRFLSEQLILAGTGGKLTMLAESGSGTLGGGAHADTFRQICRGEARRISELLQRQFDKERLARRFPGRPVLAYFTLNFREEVDLSSLADQLVKLRSAGFQADVAEVSAKFGLKLTAAPAPSAPGPFGALPPVANRSRVSSPVRPPATPLPQLLAAAAQDIAPERARVEAIIRLLEAGRDDAAFSAISKLQADVPTFARESALGKALESAMATAVVAGAEAALPTQPSAQAK